MKITGKYIRMLRKKYGLSQEDLARAAGITQAHIAKIENDKVDARLSTINKIMGVLEKAGMRTRCKDIMTKNIVAAHKNDKVSDVIKLMRKYGISQLPVIEDGKQIGSVSESCLLSHTHLDFDYVKVEEIMEDPMPMLSENASIEDVKKLLEISPSVIIISKGKIAGIVTKSDLLKVK
ncbi:MAG TPA: CBS domain-containing protein [Candidatus Aenigmarchaeota archaeon]|nr:MAG: inosine-5-monophosphate dehydrogenase [Candidatus Aenigmarchaeota archaeon]HDD46563.1 CBS domain-containing protein [Candidatus Aenigmarchaeota archaeon]